MELHRKGTPPIAEPPESTFSGDVLIEGYVRRPAPSRLAGAAVDFAPGARTPWKINPLGQTLIVTAGVGWAQAAGEDIVEIQAGDVLWFAPGERHWEGATPRESMRYVAIQEEDEAQSVQFLAAVTDEEYLAGPPA